MVPVLVMVTFFVYALLLLMPGDPVRALIGHGEALDPEQIEIIRHEMGLDKPIVVQYGAWLSRVVQGDFGRSHAAKLRVSEILRDRIPVTVQLGIAAWIWSLLIAIPAGIISAIRRGSKLDIAATVISIGGVALPSFWLGIVLILVFGVLLGWLPTHGFVNLWDDPIEFLRHLVLPAFCGGLAGAGLTMRQTRSAMLEVMAQDYIRTARAKGLKERTVIWVHALKNALLPVVTLMGLSIGRLMGGTVVIETLFGIPGVGRQMVSSITARDFPVVQAITLIVCLTVMVANLLTDLVYAYLDPRIRYT